MKKTIARLTVLVALFSASTLAGCSLDPETSKIKLDVVVEENTIILCTDGDDNDGDTLIDCADPGCQAIGTATAPLPGATVCPGKIEKDEDGNEKWVPAENTIYACSDGKDNDGNGFIDCADNNCRSLSVCCIKTGDENTVEACTDGIDNDCNGYADGADNNCKKILSPCVPTGDENTLESCSDGIDNDCDGYIDCADYSCNGGKSKDTTAMQEAIDYCTNGGEDIGGEGGSSLGSENDEESCSDRKDNNLNGLIDCADPSCAETAYCTSSEKADREVPVYSEDEYESLNAYYELVLKACTDGIDNDRNGLIDCQEYDCDVQSVKWIDYLKQNPNGDLRAYAFSCDVKEPPTYVAKNYENMAAYYAAAKASCTDGVDNDRDGYIDCDETECKNMSLKWEKYLKETPNGEYKDYAFICETDAPEPPVFSKERYADVNDFYYAVKSACTDKVDNDENESIDCEEDGCVEMSNRWKLYIEANPSGSYAKYKFTCE